MKKVNKIVSFISGIALFIQPLVGAMSLDPNYEYCLEITSPDGKVFSVQLTDEEYENFKYVIDTTHTDKSNTTQSEKSLKRCICALAKNIRNKNVSFATIDNIIDDVNSTKLPDSQAYNLLNKLYTECVTDYKIDSYKKTIKDAVHNILEDKSKKHRALNSIVKRNGINFLRQLYHMFRIIEISLDE